MPTYDARTLTPAVVHLGVGDFHRAHQAVYLDRLAEQGERGWGLVGAGLRSRRMAGALAAQEGLYTVVERGAKAAAPRVVSVMQRYLYAPDGKESLLRAMSDPRTRAISMTITAPAYQTESSYRPTGTAFDYLVEALRRRKAGGLAGFTVVSCDNLPNNGAAARDCVLQTAELRDPRLARWIKEHVAFPSSMADRITPRADLEARRELRRDYGILDRCPVTTEAFSRWVVEDSFSDGRPPLDAVGVEFVADAQPFVKAKTALLNGSHCAIGYLGHALGHRTSAEAMRNPLMREVVVQMMEDEVTPLLGRVPGLDLASYRRTLLQRFADDAVADPLSRLCARGSVRMPNYLLPSLRAALTSGRQHRFLMLVLAAWIHHLRTHEGPVETLDDPRAEMLRSLARQGGDDPRPPLSLTGVFGSLGANQPLVQDLRHTLRGFRVRGVASVLSSWTRQERVPLQAGPATLITLRHRSELSEGGARASSS